MSINVWKGSKGKNIFQSFFRKIKYSIQRIKYGYCDYDTWNFDYYFSSIIPSALRKFADETTAYPDEFKIDDFEDDESACDKWKNQLREIADLIESGGNDFTYLSKEDCLEKQKKLKDGFDLLYKYFYHLWW